LESSQSNWDTSSAPGELAQFAGELTDTMGRDGHLTIEPIAPYYIDFPFDHQPSRSEQLSSVIHHLVGREVSRVTEGEALGYLDLREVEYRKHLMRAGFYEIHRVPFSAAALKLSDAPA
jgi:hypothetical protein